MIITKSVIEFLSQCCEVDCISGATWVGHAAGTYGTDWNIYNEPDLIQFMGEL